MTWPSPLSAAAVAQQDVTYGAVAATDGGQRLWWTESRPSEGGRTTVMRSTGGGEPEELLPTNVDARTMFRSYGGRCWTPVGDGLATSHVDDQQLWLHTGSASLQLTRAAEGTRFADPVVRGEHLVCLRETPEGINLVEVPLDGSATVGVLWDRSDFVSSPAVSPSGDVAFLTWDHPSMPWDTADLRVLSNPDVPLLGGACFAPQWTEDEAIRVVCDPDGWWNVMTVRLDGTASVDWKVDEECGWPEWYAGATSHARLDRGQWAVVHGHSARHLSVLGSGRVDVPFTCWTPWLAASGSTVLAVAASATSSPAVVAIDTSTHRWRTVAAPPDPESARVPEPRTVEIRSREGHLVPAHLYPPTAPGHTATGPVPYLVVAHGGPTFQAAVRYNPMTAYYTSRGFGVVEVDYRGSSGYGRDYRMQLTGSWGIADVADCEAVGRWLLETGRAAPGQIALRGGSAGGWTTLVSMCQPDTVFSCGASWFGIADLVSFAMSTHNFEANYVRNLAGSALGSDDDPSPIKHMANCRRPVLVIQGSDDEVVPRDQALQMVAALRERGVPHAYLELEGEGHGFRRPQSMEAALEAELSFYSQVMGLGRDDVPVFTIEGW